jgi:hypothetical protein
MFRLFSKKGRVFHTIVRTGHHLYDMIAQHTFILHATLI